jgi:hypothetical protein
MWSEAAGAGAVVSGLIAMGVAGWTVKRVQELDREVAVLRKSDEFADRIIEGIKDELRAIEKRSTGRLQALESKVEMLTLKVVQINGSDG